MIRALILAVGLLALTNTASAQSSELPEVMKWVSAFPVLGELKSHQRILISGCLNHQETLGAVGYADLEYCAQLMSKTKNF